jgi:hypothetical protein
MSYNLPVEYEKYSSSVDNLIDDYTKMVDEDLVDFDGSDIMPLIAIIGRTFSNLRDTIDEIKEIDDVDRVPLYFTLLGIIIEKSVMASEKLDDSQKEQVNAAFGENGIFQMFIGMINTYINKKLHEMDTNKDKQVTKDEYSAYIYKKNMKFCGCAGKKQNLKSAICVANCCFPILSGGDDIIDLIGETNNGDIDDVDDDTDPVEN